MIMHFDYILHHFWLANDRDSVTWKEAYVKSRWKYELPISFDQYFPEYTIRSIESDVLNVGKLVSTIFCGKKVD